ncbi:MAG: glycosyltransferase family 4 protein [Candidatus Sulfotelmatobacter sp.]
MKVLLSAYYCLPSEGSESAIGWNWAREIAARGHQVFVITRAINRNAIEMARAPDSTPNLQFLFHDLSPTIQAFFKFPFGSYVYYLLWQSAAANLAVQVHAKERFDMVQHITLANFRFPTYMWKLGVPLIFGPVGGGEDTPKKLRRGLGLRGRLWDLPRRLSNSLLAGGLLMKATYAHSTQIVVTTSETLREIPFRYRSKGRIQQAIGIGLNGSNSSADHTSVLPPAPRHAKLNLLFAGRLKPWKGLHLGLKALAALGSQIQDVHLTVVGSGSDQSRLKRLSQRLGLEQSLTWIPWMDREELIQFYSEFNLFLFPSLHDSGGLVVLEAMSFGLPVLCLDLGGPGMTVDNTCGRVIPTGDRTEEELVRLMSDCLSQLFSDPAILESLSIGARSRVASLSWQAIVAKTYGPSLLLDQRTN